ncbi:hypothetical protein [Aliarcobacter butzleri]|uniref:hypothetical protein n=1 Tax=Aliarcobacter butzleri TaxID=28197 RepID=UPI00125EAC9E|nr:hypothetical protein [Aliarcobacter butzleri]
MGEIMQKEEFLKTITKEELLESWENEQERRKKADDRVRHLESIVKDLQKESDKFREWYYKERKKNEHINS